MRSNERGSINALIIPLVLFILLFIGALVFGVWAFGSRQDYKNNVDSKVGVAVAVAKKATQAADATIYAEAAKQPLRVYVGPEAYGSVHISYPKTWSAYADTTDENTPLDAYFAPGAVPGVSDQSVSFALRVQIQSQSYDQVMSQYSSQVSQQTLTASPYRLPLVPGVVGTRLDGQITDAKQGSMIVLPLRDKTLLIWTESNQYLNDFNNNILPHVSFSP